MNKKLLVLMIFSSLLWNACEDTTKPLPMPTSGITLIDTKIRDGRSSGFSFSTATMIFFPNNLGSLPDVMVSVQISQTGSILGTFLSGPNFPSPTFQLLKQFSTLDSAQAFYQTVIDISDTTFVALAIPIQIGQIWAVRTREDKYAKILVRNSLAYEDTSVPNAPPYGQVEIAWTFQPNGTRQL